MMIESKRKKIFLILAIWAMVLSTAITIINLQNNLNFKQFVFAEFIPIILMANGMFFISQISSIKLYENFIVVEYPFLKQKFEIPFDQIKYDEKNSSVLLFKANSNKIFAIRKFEFKNYLELKNGICSNSSFTPINVFSNAKKGLFSYLLTIVLISLIYLMYNI